MSLNIKQIYLSNVNASESVKSNIPKYSDDKCFKIRRNISSNESCSKLKRQCGDEQCLPPTKTKTVICPK